MKKDFAILQYHFVCVFWFVKIKWMLYIFIVIETANKVLDVPAEVENANVAEISCGLSHACAIYNGKVKCWGDSQFLPERFSVPAVLKNPRKLTAGWNHTCALGDNGLSCWGTMLNINMPNYSLEK